MRYPRRTRSAQTLSPSTALEPALIVLDALVRAILVHRKYSPLIPRDTAPRPSAHQPRPVGL